jgi:hypothetical protein
MKLGRMLIICLELQFMGILALVQTREQAGGSESLIEAKFSVLTNALLPWFGRRRDAS